MRNNNSKLRCYCKYAWIPTVFLMIVKGFAKQSTIIMWFELSGNYARRSVLDKILSESRGKINFPIHKQMPVINCVFLYVKKIPKKFQKIMSK